MSPTAVPTRITIDFRDSVHPSRTWILGLDAAPTGTAGRRVQVLASEEPAPLSVGTAVVGPRPFAPVSPVARPTAAVADCVCPDFCERDHANE
jgi:hypothetical protein